MECQASDSKKLYKVFDASRRKRSRKVKDGFDDSNSVATDDSNNGRPSVCLATSAKASMQELSALQSDVPPEASSSKRDPESSPSPTRESVRSGRSPRRHRRHQRDVISLALKPGNVSTPRSNSPPREKHCITDILTQDQDSYVYAFLEDAIKKDLRRQRRGGEGRSRDRERSTGRTHHHRRRRDGTETYPREKPTKETPAVDQTALLQTFAQICAHMTKPHDTEQEVKRSLSHKSLQCEVLKAEPYPVDQQPTRLLHQEHSWDHIPTSRVRSHEYLPDRLRHRSSPERVSPGPPVTRRERSYVYEKVPPQYGSRVFASKANLEASRDHEVDERCRWRDVTPTRSRMDHCCRRRTPDRREYRDYDGRRERTPKGDDRGRRYLEQKTSRSFDVRRDPREGYDEERCRRTTRSETNKKRYEDRDKRYDDRKEKFYEDRPMDSRSRHYANLPSKETRSRRNIDRYERNSVASREEYGRERDRNSERERDSGLSIADGENSTVSGRSNYLRVVKQEIAEQREAMDKMMKLWKELMRCFKSMSQTQGQSDKNIHESAANVQESAAAQLRLWRECMRRYETVARDVGDTDARLMEEINKQRSEMAEMSTMWQECLQRYRDMSNDFNSLKEKIATSHSPTRAVVAPLTHAEGEAVALPPNYRLPPGYPPAMPAMGGGYGPPGGSPLRTRMSAPPAWWWCDQQQQQLARRRSSPESRGSRGSRGERERRRRHKDRDESRHKEKSSKTAARSEHRHRKR